MTATLGLRQEELSKAILLLSFVALKEPILSEENGQNS
jgi:hypothetical protein